MKSTDIILKIKDRSGTDYYGGDQDWYSSNSRAMAGCSSVSAANALRCLSRTDRNCFVTIRESNKMPAPVKRALLSSSCSKDDFLMLMTGVYEIMRSFEIFPLNKIYDRTDRNNKIFKVIKPNTGRSSIGFIQGVLLFANRIGLQLKSHSLPTAFVSKNVAIDFIKKGLSSSGSVVLLTSYNKHGIKMYSPSVADKVIISNYCGCSCSDASMKCHFATITGITDSEIIITTWGKIATININELYSSWQSIKAWESTLFYFTPVKNKSEFYKSLFSSPLPFIKGILQAITRKAAR